MANGSPAGGPLIGIRPSKKPAPGPDPSSAPELSVVLPLSACSGDPGDAVARALADLAAGAEPFELLVVGPGGFRSTDPRVRPVACPPGIDRGAELSAGVLAASTDLIVPALSGRMPSAEETKSLREAMESFGAYSYLPGSPAADVAMIVRAGSAVRRLVVYGLVGVYGGDFAGPMMCRRAIFDGLGAAFTPSSLLEIAVLAKREGRVVRSVRLPVEAGGAPRGVPLAEAWRVRLSLRAMDRRSD